MPELSSSDTLSLERARFMDLELFRTRDTLAPREETELLCRVTLRLLAGMAAPSRVIDMCCGCGNLALAIAVSRRDLFVYASDLTDATVAAARLNATHLGVAGRVAVRQGDLFAGLEGLDIEGRVDLIVCNPPYISTGRLAGDRAHLLASEPREAFDGGPYGISIHQRVIAEAPRFLRPGGFLAMEFGEGQDRQVKILIERSRRFHPPVFVEDTGGVPRVVTAELL